MEKVDIDFQEIGDIEDFFGQLKKKFPLPEYFGDNLDALADVISGDLPLPFRLNFVNMSVEQLDSFESLLEVLEDLDNEVEGFSFGYFLEQYED